MPSEPSTSDSQDKTGQSTRRSHGSGRLKMGVGDARVASRGTGPAVLVVGACQGAECPAAVVGRMSVMVSDVKRRPRGPTAMIGGRHTPPTPRPTTPRPSRSDTASPRTAQPRPLSSALFCSTFCQSRGRPGPLPVMCLPSEKRGHSLGRPCDRESGRADLASIWKVSPRAPGCASQRAETHVDGDRQIPDAGNE